LKDILLKLGLSWFLLLTCISFARAEFIEKPFSGTLTVSEGPYYNSNPGYADKGNHDPSWGNKLTANLGIEVPFGSVHRYTLNSSSQWLKNFEYNKFNQVNNSIAQALDLVFNKWTLNVHYNFEDSSDPTSLEMAVVSQSLLRKKVNYPGIYAEGDLGKMKLRVGYDYQDYATNEAYDVLEYQSYTPFIDLAVKMTPLWDAFMRYTYTRTDRNSNEMNGSDDNDIKVGARGDLTPYLAGEVGVGYSDVSFDDTVTGGDDSDFSGVVYSGSLSNRISQLTTQQLSFSLSPEQGYNVGNYYTCYDTKYTITHQLNSKINIDFLTEYLTNLESGTSYDKENSKIWIYGAGFSYALAKNLNLGLDYKYSDKDSKRAGKSYVVHETSLGLNYTF